MWNFLKVAAFSVLVIVLFSVYSNYGVPRIEPAAPPKEEKLELGALTMDQYVALGGRIFAGKGTCKLCHNPVGKRAPLLDKIDQVTQKRLADPRYKGKAKDVETYLYESMVEPSAYVVTGFGKTGTNDTVSPMPNVSTGGISLDDAQIKAVIAYLQDSSGLDVTVEIPEEAAEKTAEDAGEEEGEPRKPYGTPEEAIAEFSCGACHRIGAEEGEEGPDLRHIGAKRGKDELRRSILDPNAEISKGFKPDMMPADYGEQMYAKELEMMVEFLAGQK